LSDPTVAVHLSGKEFARILADELGEPSIFKENIGVEEQMETQQEAQSVETKDIEQQMIAEELGI